MIGISGDTIVVASLMGLVYLVFAVIAVRRFSTTHLQTDRSLRAVTILKPVCGSDPGLYHNLVSFCRQSYRGPVQIVIGAHRESDPAVTVARQVIADIPDADIALVIDGTLAGTNFKVCNLANMMAVAKHDVLIVSDSDMRVRSNYLNAVVETLLRPGVGIATTLYKATPVGGFASKLACGFINYGFIPSVLVGKLLNAAPFCSGSTVAIRRETLAAIGGFGVLINQLADDFVIGDLVRGLGLDVVLAPYIAENFVLEPSVKSLFRHELRWQRTIRTITPLGLAASVITNPASLALLALPLTGFASGVWLLLAVTMAARLTLVYTCNRMFDLTPMGFWLVPLREFMSQLVLGAAFCGQRITWRDSSFQVNRGGELTFEGDKLI